MDIEGDQGGTGAGSEPGGGGSAAAEPTLRESLSAAFAEAGEGGGGKPDSASPAAVEPKPANASQAGGEPAAGERARAPDGKFAPKVDWGGQGAAPPPAAAAAPPNEPPRPPAAWSAPAKAKFATLDPAVQAEIVKRELDVARGMTAREQQIQRYKPIDDVLAPGRDQRAMQGQDDAAYVRALVSADGMLASPDKAKAQAALQHLARVYQIPLSQPGQGQQPAQAQLHPEIQQLRQQVQTLTQAQQQCAQAEGTAHQQQVQSTIQAFEADPKNVYFPNVREDMGVLLQAGRAKTLEEAYDMACHMRSDIRPLIAAASAAPATSEAARQRAAAARQASGSVTGAPGPGSSAQAAPPNRSIRDELKAQFEAAT